MKKITDEELKSLQTMTAEFNKLKTQLGDLALQKQTFFFYQNKITKYVLCNVQDSASKLI